MAILTTEEAIVEATGLVAEKIIEHVGAKNEEQNAEINKLKEDLVEEKSKTKDITATSNDDNKDKLFITDGQGNVIAKIDGNGVHSTDFTTPDGSVTDYNNLKNKPNNVDDIIPKYNDAFYVTDGQGNVIFKADKNGVHSVNIDNSSANPYKGMKLITIGDSLSSHDKWQKWLVEWLGVTFDLDENINGRDGHSPMAVGGTAVRPQNESSIYIRSLDTKYYCDKINGTIIIIYAGQNDWIGSSDNNYMYLGTVNDEPYRDRVIPESYYKTFASYYKGMIENLLEDCPNAHIFIMNQMKVDLGTSIMNENEKMRKMKADLISEIAKYYGLPLIDQWNCSGVNHFNASMYYPNIGNVHQTDMGYKQTALTVYRAMI